MNHQEIRMGMLSGMSLSLYVQFPLNGIIETSMLAATGALVSFVVGRLLQWMVRKWGGGG